MREFDRALDGTFVVGDASQNGGVHGLAFEQHAVELLLLRIGSAFEEIEDGQRELATGEIGAQCFTDGFFITHDVEAVVVNLVGGAELEAVVTQCRLHGVGLMVESRTQFASGGKKRGGLHLDHLEIIGD